MDNAEERIDLCNTLEVLRRYFPQLGALNPQPRRWIDHIAIPGTLIRLVTTTPLSADVLATLYRNSNVVARQPLPAVGQGQNFYLTSDFGNYHQFTRSGLRAHNEWDASSVPLCWSLEVCHAAVLPPLVYPPPGALAGLRPVYRAVSAIVSAHELRRALTVKDVGLPARALAQLDALDAASQAGNCFYYPCSTVPPSLRLSPDGSCLVVQNKIHQRGPWIVTTLANPQHVIAALQPSLDTLGQLRPLELGPPLSIGPAPLRVDGRSRRDLTREGRMGNQAMTRVRDAECARRWDVMNNQSYSLQPPVPLPTVPQAPVPTVFLLARTVNFSKKKYSQETARQIVSMIDPPPPGVDDDWGNVGRVVLVVERTADWAIPWAERKAVRKLLQWIQPGDLLAVINPDRITRISSEVRQVINDFGDHLYVRGMRAQPLDGELRVQDHEDREDQEHDELAPDDSQEGVTDWASAKDDDRFEKHIKVMEYLSGEHRFHALSHSFMKRHLQSDQALVRSSLTAYAVAQDLRRTVLFDRVSEGELGENNVDNDSRNRQHDFLRRLSPANFERERLDQVSISLDGTPVVHVLERNDRCLVIVTSVDRVARNPRAMAQIRTVCSERQVHLVAVLWPADALRDLVALGTNPLLDPASRQLLMRVMPAAMDSRSQPGFWPTLIAGPGVSEGVQRVVDRRIAASQGFVQGFQSSSYQGNPRILIPTSLETGDGGTRAFPPALQTALVAEVERARPALHNKVEIEVFEYRDSVNCGCTALGCKPGCMCRCPQICTVNYAKLCTHVGVVTPDMCPCTCPACH